MRKFLLFLGVLAAISSAAVERRRDFAEGPGGWNVRVEDGMIRHVLTSHRPGSYLADTEPLAVEPGEVVAYAAEVRIPAVLRQGVYRLQAVALRARVILSTPCCHRQLSRDIRAKELAFVTDYPQLRGKLCEALTDGLRLLALECAGYAVQASELTDPENTPKNTLLRAVLRKHFDPDSAQAQKKQAEYRAALAFLLGKDVARYPEEP